MDELDTSTSNPLNGYTAAVQAAIDVASGKSKSRLRLDAAALLFEHCSYPPWTDWGLVLVDEDGDEDAPV